MMPGALAATFGSGEWKLHAKNDVATGEKMIGSLKTLKLSHHSGLLIFSLPSPLLLPPSLPLILLSSLFCNQVCYPFLVFISFFKLIYFKKFPPLPPLL